jgi:hypothetical protein
MAKQTSVNPRRVLIASPDSGFATWAGELTRSALELIISEFLLLWKFG